MFLYSANIRKCIKNPQQNGRYSKTHRFCHTIVLNQPLFTWPLQGLQLLKFLPDRPTVNQLESGKTQCSFAVCAVSIPHLMPSLPKSILQYIVGHILKPRHIIQKSTKTAQTARTASLHRYIIDTSSHSCREST